MPVRWGAETQAINAPEFTMSTPPRTSLLRRLIGMPSETPRQDPADMGTAIGLDYILDQPPLPEPGVSRASKPGAARRNWLPKRPS